MDIEKFFSADIELEDGVSQLLNDYWDEAWELAITEYPIFELTQEDRKDILDNLCLEYTFWVLRGDSGYVDHSWDPPWDSSGSFRREKVGEGALLYKYTSIGDWLEEELTGYSEATYLSGHGLNHPTFRESFREELMDRIIPEYFAKNLSEEEWDEVYEGFGFHDAFILFPMIAAEAIIRVFEGYSTEDVWRRFEKIAVEKVEQEKEIWKRKAKFKKRCKELSAVFVANHFPEFLDEKTEWAEWNSKNIKERLEEILEGVDIKFVIAVAEVSMDGKISNKVVGLIKTTAKGIIKQRKEETDPYYVLGVEL